MSKADFYIKAAIAAGVLYVGYRIYSGISGLVGGLGDAVKKVADMAEEAGDVLLGTTATEVLEACRAALKAKGLNPDNYYMLNPQPRAGQKLPAGTWMVTYKGGKYYFAPKGATFGPFTL